MSGVLEQEDPAPIEPGVRDDLQEELSGKQPPAGLIDGRTFPVICFRADAGETGLSREARTEAIPMDDHDPIEVPIDGTLDLHTFRPRDVKDLVPEYLAACRERGILQVRIIHGKGTGALRETVHVVLRRLPEVASFQLAGEDAGAWGATLVDLFPE